MPLEEAIGVLETYPLRKDTKKKVPNMKAKAFEGEAEPGQTCAPCEDEISKLIQTCRIDISEVLEPPPVAMSIESNGEKITLFTKGNFSIVTGAAKSRKTFLLSMLMAAAIKGSFDNDFFCCKTKGANILFDTEQSRYKTQQNTKRIVSLTGKESPDNMHVYSLRTLEPGNRLALIDRVLAETPDINFVAIDGIIDLDNDPILDVHQAQKIITKLLQWTEIYNIHIVCVLHYNKTASTIAGHLGTFAHRKADAIIEVSKDKDSKNISFVKAIDCREIEFSPFAFSIDDNGIPGILRDYEISGQGKKKQTTPALPLMQRLNSEIYNQVLSEVFKVVKQQQYKLFEVNMKIAFEACGNKVGETAIKQDIIPYLLDDEYIKKINVKGKRHPVYMMAETAPEVNDYTPIL